MAVQKYGSFLVKGQMHCGATIQICWGRGPYNPLVCIFWYVHKDLLRMGITWEEAEVAAQNRSEWRRGVAQCIHLNQGQGHISVTVNVPFKLLVN